MTGLTTLVFEMYTHKIEDLTVDYQVLFVAHKIH